MSLMEIRPANPDDKAAIVAFCENTFSWGDYIDDAWDRWITDHHGKIFVGLVDTQPVAMVHVALLEKGVVWMEGMRVHPDFRRHGIGTAIDIAGRSYARERGHPIARLATSIHNIPAQKALDVQGYSKIAEFDEWVALPSEASHSQVRIAGPDDVPLILAMWDRSDTRIATRSLLPDHWRWTELTEARLARHIEAHHVRIASGGFGLFSTSEGEDPEFLVQALAGDEGTLTALASTARAEAGYRGYARIEAFVAHQPRMSSALERSGYTHEGGMLIYEQVS
jgi:GNAT superfamily N-acetyltransferase